MNRNRKSKKKREHKGIIRSRKSKEEREHKGINRTRIRFPLMTYHGCVTRLTRRVSLVEQELITFPAHLNSPQFLVEFNLPSLSISRYRSKYGADLSVSVVSHLRCVYQAQWDRYCVMSKFNIALFFVKNTY
jgi:hypothetical protein